MAEGLRCGEDVPAVDAQPYIDAYVEQLKQSGGIRTPAVAQAFRRVPRHSLIQSFYTFHGQDYTKYEHDPANPDPKHLELIYSHNPLVTRLHDGQPTSSSSQPSLMAEMLELLELDEGMTILEIGAGTGYNAAILSEIAGDPARVTTIDVQPDVVAQTQDLLAKAGYAGIHVHCGDGFYGVPEAAPYDRIIVTVGSAEISPHWLGQLRSSGFLLIPLRHAGANPLVAVSQVDDAITGKVVSMSGFMPIQGELHDPAYSNHSLPATELPIEQVPVWPGLYPTGALKQSYWQGDAWGFWFYLGIRDRRTRLTQWGPSFGLVEPQSSHWVNLDHDHLTGTGDSALLHALETYYDEWRQLGSPHIQDFTITFVPMAEASGGTLAEAQWSVEGRYYTRIFALARQKTTGTQNQE